MDLILQRLPGTLLLMMTALGFALLLGIVLGSVMAAWAGKWPDRLLSVVVLLLYSMPGFWVGLMAVVLFSVKLGWLPNDGNETIGANLTGLAFIADRLVHLVLPALALASFFVAVYARLVRTSMLEVQRQDFMRTAHAKGLNPLLIQLRHALRNALIPVTTVAGMHLGNLLGRRGRGRDPVRLARHGTAGARGRAGARFLGAAGRAAAVVAAGDRRQCADRSAPCLARSPHW